MNHATAPARPRTHWTTKVGVAGVILCVLVVASLNVTGWRSTLPGPPGVAAAVVAVGLELIAFVAWEHICKYAKGRDWGRLALAAIGLALAAVVNIEGGHRGIEHIAAPLYADADAGRRERQGDLDSERAKLEVQIADLQARVDAVAATNPGVTLSGRMTAWRQNFEAVTAEDRAQIAALRRAQNDLPLTAVYARPFPAWGPYALAAVFAFISLFGLTMFEIKVVADFEHPPPAAPARPHRKLPWWRLAMLSLGLAAAPAVAAAEIAPTPHAVEAQSAAEAVVAHPASSFDAEAKRAEAPRRATTGAPRRRAKSAKAPITNASIERAVKALARRHETLGYRRVAAELGVAPSRLYRSDAWRSKWAHA